MHEIVLETRKKIELVNITKYIEKEVAKQNIKEGIIVIMVPHTSASLIINENEEGLIKDIEKALQNIVPKMQYAHNKTDNNAEAHIMATLLSDSKTIIIKNGKMAIGQWQNIFFAEMDGPRTRQVYIQILECR